MIMKRLTLPIAALCTLLMGACSTNLSPYDGKTYYSVKWLQDSSAEGRLLSSRGGISMWHVVNTSEVYNLEYSFTLLAEGALFFDDVRIINSTSNNKATILGDAIVTGEYHATHIADISPEWVRTCWINGSSLTYTYYFEKPVLERMGFELLNVLISYEELRSYVRS